MSFMDMLLVVRLGPDADERELVRATGQLRKELLSHPVEDVRLAPLDGDGPAGTKSGTLLSFGTLVVTLGPQAISALLAALQTWAERDAARSVEIRLGDDSFVGSGLTRGQQDALVAGFLERIRSADAAAEPVDGGA